MAIAKCVGSRLRCTTIAVASGEKLQAASVPAGRTPAHFGDLAMKKIGLALSGGGHRAALYHLGLVRFLRDAGILPKVTHITSVSGGSIFAAHLALKWDRYNGSPHDFDAAASELLDYIRLDVRNRIVRRFPLCYLLRWPRRLLGLSNRKLTLTGLLEYHYGKYLFGDTSLFRLPECPELHILATNLSEGCLCSFNREGLWIMRRQPGHGVRIDRVHAALATVPMAVTASSAFPGFFPPIQLTGADVGAEAGAFGRQSYTDGGVFDNLGVRMFHCLEKAVLTGENALDGVLVSDVGKSISNRGNQRTGGLIRTAMRSSDILMDRVWQLESEGIEETPGFVFAHVTEVVDPKVDPTAMHPEIQRQTANIRTDLDRFSALEISSLIRHGYCVGRKACRSRPDLFGADLPTGPPWDPIPEAHGAARAAPPAPNPTGPRHETDAVTTEARRLQASSQRRIWSRLFDYRDWISYVYVPIIVPLLTLLPYFVVKVHERSVQLNRLVDSLSHGSPDLDVMSRLLQGPIKPWVGDAAEEVKVLAEPDFKGFAILQDSRILDLRAWNPSGTAKYDTESLVYGYRRVTVLKLPNHAGNNLFHITGLATHPKSQFRFPLQELQPKLRMTPMESTIPGEKFVRWDVSADFSEVPAGDFVDVAYEHISPGHFLRRGAGSTAITFQTQADTAEVTRWFLLPQGRQYRSFRILRWETGKPEKLEPVRVVNKYLADDSTILAYKLLSEKAGYTHEVTLYYK
jgi:predicted acylesterase/phospholipase RssA